MPPPPHFLPLAHAGYMLATGQQMIPCSFSMTWVVSDFWTSTNFASCALVTIDNAQRVHGLSCAVLVMGVGAHDEADKKYSKVDSPWTDDCNGDCPEESCILGASSSGRSPMDSFAFGEALRRRGVE